MTEINLQLDKFPYYMGLKYHMEDAFKEYGIDPSYANPCPIFAIFSKSYYNELNKLNHTKIHDFCFIGSISSCPERREWVIDFAKKYFTSNSVFINTDNANDWELLGDFDYSCNNKGFCPKIHSDNQSRSAQYRVIEENKYYFETMCQSKFVLCPAGDSLWSFRFYETIMCKSLPIVETWHHTYRTREESDIDYKYLLPGNFDSRFVYNAYVTENTKLFEKHHMINVRPIKSSPFQIMKFHNN